MNTYLKFAPNVFVAKCENQCNKGEIIELTTKYGQTHDCIVFNLVGRSNDGSFLYSIVRADGYNVQERAKAKAERYRNWSESAENKSDALWKASEEGRDFLSMGEPIKVGHHSEKRHRALIDRNHNRMDRAMDQKNKSEYHESRAEYWEKKTNDINLSMPESVEFWEYKFEEAKEKHLFYKENPKKREHSFSLTYAKKALNEAEKNLNIAKLLWQE